jgi:hypothetical protein
MGCTAGQDHPAKCIRASGEGIRAIGRLFQRRASEATARRRRWCASVAKPPACDTGVVPLVGRGWFHGGSVYPCIVITTSLQSASMVAASFALHWFRFTSHEDMEAVCDRIGGEFGPVEHHGNFNQPCRIQHESGARIFFGSPRAEQPLVCDVPGEACERAAERFVAVADDLRANVTRYDVACDVEPAELATKRLMSCWRAVRSGKCDTHIPATSVHLIKSERPDEGNTLYVGSRESTKFFRIYDRRGPLRCEVECKPGKEMRAHVPDLLRRYGMQHAWSNAASSLVFPFDWYQQLYVKNQVDLQPPERSPTELLTLLDSLSQQVGVSLFMLQSAGLDLTKLVRAPGNVSGDWVRAWRQRSYDADEMGLDGEAIRKVIKWASKSRQK